MPEVSLALGRILRMAFGDAPWNPEMYEKCRSIIMGSAEPKPEYAVSWARDRLKGAQGD